MILPRAELRSDGSSDPIMWITTGQIYVCVLLLISPFGLHSVVLSFIVSF